MSSSLESKTAIRQLAAEAETVVKATGLTTAQKQAKLDRIEADIKGHQDRIRLHESGNRLILGGSSIDSTDGAPGGVQPHRKGIYAGLVAQGYAPIPAPQLDLSTTDTKALYDAAARHQSLAITTKVATDSTSITPAAITDYRLPPVTALREPTRVLSLIPNVATDHPSVTWYSTTGTAAAAAVAEGGTKPTSSIAYTAQTSSVTKIAHVAEVTDETLQDFPSFMGVLTQDMVAGLIKAENDELLNAAVTGAHKFPGLLNTTGILTRAKSTEIYLDTLEMALDDLRAGTSFAEPDGIILNPATWGLIRRSKDSNGRFYIQPDPTQAHNPNVWGIPVVLSTQIAAGTALVGDFGNSTAAYVREGIRVETANQGSAQFTANTTLIRCEERLLLTVPRPTGLIKVTGLV